MSKKSRLIIILTGVFLFSLITPYIILYSLGYRIDFEHKKLIATGGMYIRALPTESTIIVNENLQKTISFFSNYFFVQNLLPKEHTILITKEGYAPYQKKLMVKEREVTKLEHVVLFKPNPLFTPLSNTTEFHALFDQKPDRFILKNTQLFYNTASKENETLSSLEQKTPLLKGVLTYAFNNNRITWLTTDGSLHTWNLSEKQPRIIGEQVITMHPKKTYQLLFLQSYLFLKEQNAVFLYDQSKNIFTPFANNASLLTIAPDGQKIAYVSDHRIFVHYVNTDLIKTMNDTSENPVTIYTGTDPITFLTWVNKEYIIFREGEKIALSEIDTRSIAHTVFLTSPITASNQQVIDLAITTPFFDTTKKKLYITIPSKTTPRIFVSEPLAP